ncbi:MAG TPA: guanylate kinase [Candidatus Anammoximicrobium sp.]|nr:guanylate kinase [Candidatus Anammoximicrobium sp.]
MSGSSAGRLVIISGPSGAGKSTVVRQLLDTCPLPLQLSVSATTRSPRPGERDGVEYHFVSHDEFCCRRAAGEFLEWKEVFGRGHLYGTLRSETTAGLAAGKWIILEIDVEGALAVLQQHPEAITVFVHPGSMEELERRLRGRGTDSEESIQRRLTVARRELACKDRYRYEVINDSKDRAVREICEILRSQAGCCHERG